MPLNGQHPAQSRVLFFVQDAEINSFFGSF